MMKENYVNCIWKRKPWRFFNNGKSILLMDSAKCYLVDDVEQTFLDINSIVKFIHGGKTPLLQFLHTHVNKPFKDIMKERRED